MTAWVRRLTPPGRGGVALVALEGPGAAALLAAALSRPPPAVGRVAVGRLADPDGAEVDEVLVARGAAEAFEVGCHGGPAVVEAVVAALVARGARPGAPPAPDGDRAAVEAAALLPRATTALGAKVALAQAGGALRRAARAARARLAAGEDPSADLAALLATAPLGRALFAPPAVAVVGPPNAGKSSLVNALAGRERAIVAAVPGTTRDALEVDVDLEGVPARLVDTAGQRPADDPVERAGVARAVAAAAEAALRLAVVDGAALAAHLGRGARAGGDAEGDGGLALAAATPAPRLRVVTKRDRLDAAALAAVVAAAAPDVVVVAPAGEGLAPLRAALRAALVGPPAPAEGAVVDDLPVLLTPRQAGLVEGALRALRAGRPDKAVTCLRALVGDDA